MAFGVRDGRVELIAFDTSAALRAQLPYITDGGKTVGDSDTILAGLASKLGLYSTPP